MKTSRYVLAALAVIILMLVLPSSSWSQASQDRKEETIAPNIKVVLEKITVPNPSEDVRKRYAAYYDEFKKDVAARASSFSKDCEFTLRLLTAERTKVILIEVGLSKKGDPKEMISTCQFFSKSLPMDAQAPLPEIIKTCLDRVVSYAKCTK